MATWSRLRERLAGVTGRVTITWRDLDELVGGLPRSAYAHPAFWSGARSGWPGFRTVDVRVGGSVTFVRREQSETPTVDQTSGDESRAPRELTETVVAAGPPREPAADVDVLLVGCVKSKMSHPAPARDLYTSALFRKERAYAEAAGVPWFILSAEHGLVAPTQVIAPYELHLSTTPRDYQAAWGARVVDALRSSVGGLADRTIEIHAGAAYVDAIRAGLVAAGAAVVEPLAGLTMGERLAWYGRPQQAEQQRARPKRQSAPVASSVRPAGSLPAVDELVGHLRDSDRAMSVEELLDAGGAGLGGPGLYSWWVDQQGADDLSSGLGEAVAPGLIYAGLAGATRSRSGRRSSNTLWGRLKGMHLGARHELSTFRLSLGSVLASFHGSSGIDEEELTAWMHAHLRVVVVPVADADALDRLETGVLDALDPPLNLAKMSKSAIRDRLKELRRLHGS